jgi:nitrogen fixation protein NifU and related proteins
MEQDIEELYQEIILDHSRRPRNFGYVVDAAICVRGDNPICGDQIDVTIRFDSMETLEDIKFSGRGCAICQASASLMTIRLRGKASDQAAKIFESFRNLLVSEKPTHAENLGDLRAMEGVRQFPLRVKCAMLPWRAAEEALKQRSGKFTVSTETKL